MQIVSRPEMSEWCNVAEWNRCIEAKIGKTRSDKERVKPGSFNWGLLPGATVCRLVLAQNWNVLGTKTGRDFERVTARFFTSYRPLACQADLGRSDKTKP